MLGFILLYLLGTYVVRGSKLAVSLGAYGTNCLVLTGCGAAGVSISGAGNFLRTSLANFPVLGFVLFYLLRTNVIVRSKITVRLSAILTYSLARTGCGSSAVEAGVGGSDGKSAELQMANGTLFLVYGSVCTVCGSNGDISTFDMGSLGGLVYLVAYGALHPVVGSILILYGIVVGNGAGLAASIAKLVASIFPTVSGLGNSLGTTGNGTSVPVTLCVVAVGGCGNAIVVNFNGGTYSCGINRINLNRNIECIVAKGGVILCFNCYGKNISRNAGSRSKAHCNSGEIRRISSSNRKFCSETCSPSTFNNLKCGSIASTGIFYCKCLCIKSLVNRHSNCNGIATLYFICGNGGGELGSVFCHCGDKQRKKQERTQSNDQKLFHSVLLKNYYRA